MLPWFLLFLLPRPSLHRPRPRPGWCQSCLPLGGAGGAVLFANYRPRNPERVSFWPEGGWLGGPHKCWRGWNGPAAWCLHCDLWNVPSKRILTLREFLRGSRSRGTMLNQHLLSRVFYPAIHSKRLWLWMVPYLSLCCFLKRIQTSQFVPVILLGAQCLKRSRYSN